jgi:hypothetical protein
MGRGESKHGVKFIGRLKFGVRSRAEVSVSEPGGQKETNGLF